MKNLLLPIFLTLFLIGGKTYSQTYKDKLKDDICECLQEENITDNNFKNVYEKCFTKHLVSYANIIDSEIKEENKTLKYKKGQEARLKLRLEFESELIYTCDIYFNTIEGARIDILQIAQSKAIDSRELEALDQQIAMRPNWMSYLARAQFHLQLGNLDDAKKDVLTSIEACPAEDNLTLRKPKLLLAWILEEQKRYRDAISIYNDIQIGYADTQVAILKAIITRKSKGNNILMPKQRTIKKDSLTKIKSNEENKSDKPLKTLFKLGND